MNIFNTYRILKIFRKNHYPYPTQFYKKRVARFAMRLLLLNTCLPSTYKYLLHRMLLSNFPQLTLPMQYQCTNESLFSFRQIPIVTHILNFLFSRNRYRKFFFGIGRYRNRWDSFCEKHLVLAENISTEHVNFPICIKKFRR